MTLTAHFKSEELHFKCSIAPCVPWPILDSAVLFCPDFPSHLLLNSLHLGFCLHHSSEIALVKVPSNPHFALPRDQFLAHVLPDLPATLNPGNHSFLPDELPSLGFQTPHCPGFSFVSLVAASVSFVSLASSLCPLNTSQGKVLGLSPSSCSLY